MSLKKIASMVGTSVSTVSRVLNNTSSTCASKELQDKIWAAARQINYHPNENARSLKKSSEPVKILPNISIVLARISSLEEDPFFSELFRDLEIELLKQNASINNVIYANESHCENITRSDGVLILGRCSHKLLENISRQNRNVVGIWRNPMNFNVDEVVCDGKKAAEMAMKYLFSLGHQRIAYIGDCSFERRYVGYCDMLIRNDIPMDYELIKQTKGDAETAFSELLEKKLAKETDFTAVFCANDNTAIHVLELLKAKKRQIKQPISVISIDNIEAAQNTQPYLTTIHIPHQEMAHMAVALLLDRISKEHKEVVRIEFPCRIMERNSCYQCSTN